MSIDTENHKTSYFRTIIPRGLVVSCQAHRLDPLYGSLFMQKMAESAALGGAIAIRANGFQDIKAICQTVSLPIIGIVKDVYPSSPVTITPTFREACEAARAGASVIALDGTRRVRTRSRCGCAGHNRVRQPKRWRTAPGRLWWAARLHAPRKLQSDSLVRCCIISPTDTVSSNTAGPLMKNHLQQLAPARYDVSPINYSVVIDVSE